MVPGEAALQFALHVMFGVNLDTLSLWEDCCYTELIPGEREAAW